MGRRSRFQRSLGTKINVQVGSIKNMRCNTTQMAGSDTDLYKSCIFENTVMSACPNMIKNFNLRKVWKYIRNKHLNSDKNAKIDSDSILMEMRTKTDMAAEYTVRKKRVSLEYVRNNCGEYQVAYKPMTFRMAMDYKKDSKSSFQQWFHDLSVQSPTNKTIDLSVLQCNQKCVKTGIAS